MQTIGTFSARTKRDTRGGCRRLASGLAWPDQPAPNQGSICTNARLHAKALKDSGVVMLWVKELAAAAAADLRAIEFESKICLDEFEWC